MDNNTQIPKRPTQYLDGGSRASYFAPVTQHVQSTQPTAHQSIEPVYYDQNVYLQNDVQDASIQKSQRRTISLHLRFKRPQTPKIVGRAMKLLRPLPVRITAGLVVLVFIASEAILIFGPNMAEHTYAMGSAEPLLPAKSAALEKHLSHDAKQDAFTFNPGFTPVIDNKSSSMGPQISAVAYKDATRGLSVTDPLNNVDFVMKPKFQVLPGEQNSNRIVYPLKDGTGWLVYTMQGGQVKEDVLLRFSRGDKMSLKYEVPLGDAMEMRLGKDGSIGVYGTDLPLYGNISTGTDKDKELLKKAQKKAPKTKLLFTIPAPVVNEYGKTKSNVSAKYVVNDKEIKVEVSGLKSANYPLSIDPSVYVTSAQEFMRGNNESNIDFDTTNELIQKGKLTGARISGWNDTTALSAGRWNSAVTVGGGYVYAVGGSNGSTTSNAVYWSRFSTSSNVISNPDPTNCSGWCTNSSYSLPANRAGLSTVIYNGYIYAIGGTDSSCVTTNNVCSTVYYSKIGANGEPIGWTAASSLGTARRFAGAVAYNNKIYVLGGQTALSLNGSASVEAADIRPDGTLSAWTTTGMTALPTTQWGFTALQNNGFIYIVGGANGNAALATVQYIKIKTDGTLDAWVTSTSFTTGRMTFGGSFATIYGNYLYVTVGCSSLTTTSCSGMTTAASDFQLASLNADGSVTPFTQHSSNVPTVMTGYGLVSWRGALYAIGGCTVVSGPTSCSGATQTAVKYGTINADGDVSTVNSISTLPTAGNGSGQAGRIASGVVVNNGYIYNIGGCANVGCTTMSDNTAFAAIATDGTLTAPSTCTTGTLVNTIWCVDSTRTLNGSTGLGAFGVTVYNNTIYTVGGRTGASGGDSALVCRATLNSDGSLPASYSCAAPSGLTAGASIFAFTRAQPNNATNGYIYMIGGCTTTSSGVGCDAYLSQVVRCTITNAGGAPSTCGTSGQQQLRFDTVNSRGGLGIAGGAVYGNYVYLAGGANSFTGSDTSPTGNTCSADAALGVSSCGGQLNIVQYAKIDSSGNITRTDGTVNITGPNVSWNVTAGKLTAARSQLTAFGVNGYLYAVGGADSSNAPASTLMFGKITMTTGDIASFSSSGTAITARWGLGAVYSGGYAYIIGGCTSGNAPSSCSAMSGVGEYVQIYNNWTGSPASYVSSTNRFTTDRYGGAATVMNGYLYLAGGCTDSGSNDCVTTNGTSKSSDVSYAPLNPDGSLGTWASISNALGSNNRAFGRLENSGGTLYYIGGLTGGNGAPRTEVMFSTVGAGGVPATFSTTGMTALTGGRAVMSSAVYNGHIYVTGGISTGSGSGSPQATVYISSDVSNGGAITSWDGNVAYNFNIARSGHVTVAYGGKLYVMGGMDVSSNYLMDVQYATINSDGTIGSWIYGTSLPTVLRQGDGVATNGFIYIFGGRSSSTTCTNNSYIVPINGDGSIGAWSQTNTKFTGPRFGAAAAYLGGRVYILGGACGSSPVLTGNDRTVYATAQLQPQIASYSMMIDADVNVFPSKYLINGLDGGIGASWFMKYISSTTGNNTWGQVTNVGKLNLGTPGTYTPLDAAGVDTNAPPTGVGAQYYMFLLNIDVQQAFGFPEDVNRGPNIYDITLLYTSTPGKRLIHGKTFTGGLQQPLDTPF